MVCLGFEPGAAGWKAQMNPLSYGGTPFICSLFVQESATIVKHTIWASIDELALFLFAITRPLRGRNRNSESQI